MYGQAFPKYPKIQVFNIFAMSVKRSEIWSWLLEHQSFLQGNRNDHENVKGMVMGWSSVLKVLKVQVCNVFTISLKKVKNRLQYGVHQDQNFCKSDCQFLMKARHFQSTRKRKFANFLPNFKKKNHNCFCVLLWCQILRYFTRFQLCLLLHSNIPTSPICQDSPGFWYTVLVSWTELICPGFYIFHYFFFSYLHNFSSAF